MRVTYARDSILQEWFVNDLRGLEHGFTVLEKPAASDLADATLDFTLAVRSGLPPAITADA